MFHLIEFLLNKTVAVVPQNWYSDGVTYWPNYKNDERVNRAVKNSEEPGPDWRKYDARVIKSCSIFILNNLNGCCKQISKYFGNMLYGKNPFNSITSLFCCL